MRSQKGKLRYLVIFCILALLLGAFSACGKKGQAPASANEEKQEVTDNAENKDNTEVKEETPEPKEDEDVKPAPEETPEPSPEVSIKGHLLLSTSSDQVYYIDDNGAMVKNIDLAALRKKFDKDEYFIMPANFIGEYYGKIIYSEYTTVPGTDSFGTVLYALDSENGKEVVIWSAEGSGYSLLVADIYNDELYITVTESGDYKEYRLIPDGDGYKKEETENSALFSAITNGCGTVFPSASNLMIGCISRDLDELGFTVYYDSNYQKYYRLFKDGSKVALNGMPATLVYDTVCFDKESLVYIYRNYYSDEDTPSGIYRYDFSEGTASRVMDDDLNESYVSVLAFKDGLLYVSKDMGVRYGISEMNYFAVDVKTGDAKLLYYVPDVPGTNGAYSGATSGFYLINGDIYATTVMGDELKWAKVRATGELPDYTDINCPLKTYNTLRYGKIYCESVKQFCAGCGIPINEVYEEYFQLDGSVSPNADKINKTLKDEFDEYMAIAGEDGDMIIFSREECEEHQEYPSMYLTTEDTTINDVFIIRDRYLAIESDSYWDGGGAHGMPGRSQKLFDLTTGEKLTIKDFFNGSEEDFKKLCGRCAAADLENYEPSNSPYYEYDDTAVYSDAYEISSFEHSDIDFREDGAYIIFAPYELGPYASGFISFKLLDASEIYK